MSDPKLLIDMHMHSTVSDGTDSPIELLNKVKAAGIRIFGLTDHDAFQGAMELKEYLKKHPDPDLEFHPGIEFSCYFMRPLAEGEAGPEAITGSTTNAPDASSTRKCKCHILGYDYDPADPAFLSVYEEGRAKRLAKLTGRLNYLEETYGIRFSQKQLEEFETINSVGKPHLAKAMIQAGYVEDGPDAITYAIKTYINGYKAGNDRVDAVKAISAIRQAGGIAIWAHPIGGEGEKRLTWEEFERQLTYLTAAGLQGLECHYSRYSADEESRLLSYAKTYGLWISGGSDYHGTNKNIPLAALNNYGRTVYSEEVTWL